MTPDLQAIYRNSILYRVVRGIGDVISSSRIPPAIRSSVCYRTLRGLTEVGQNSLAFRLLNSERALLTGAVVVVAISMVRILLSGLHVAIRFMSFVLFAVLLAVLVWPYTKPLSNP